MLRIGNNANRGYILEKGRISYAGTAADLHGSEELLSGLGVSARAVPRRGQPARATNGTGE